MASEIPHTTPEFCSNALAVPPWSDITARLKGIRQWVCRWVVSNQEEFRRGDFEEPFRLEEYESWWQRPVDADRQNGLPAKKELAPPWVRDDPKNPHSILEVGSYDGRCAVHMAQRFTDTPVYAVDKNAMNTLMAQASFRANKTNNAVAVHGKIQIYRKDPRFQKTDIMYSFFPLAWTRWGLFRMVQAMAHLLNADGGKLIMVTEDPRVPPLLEKTGLEVLYRVVLKAEAVHWEAGVTYSNLYRDCMERSYSTIQHLFIIYARKPPARGRPITTAA